MATTESCFKGFTFHELLTPAGLARLDLTFLDYLKHVDVSCYAELLRYRQGTFVDPEGISAWLIRSAPLLESFIAELFFIEAAVAQQQAHLHAQDPIFQFKKEFVLRQARRVLCDAKTFASFEVLDRWLTEQLHQKQIALRDDRELAVARYAQAISEDPEHFNDEIQRLIQWCVQAQVSELGKKSVRGWVSFHFPAKLQYNQLVDVLAVSGDTLERQQGNEETFRYREGFKLTDERMSQRQVLDEAHYCVYCHKNDGDFCSKGFPVKKTDPSLGLKVNPLHEILTGCPLEEKISEMHFLKKSGYSIAALATVMVDNPMCPATGHRICNDCMKACIYQKQEPVNIPQIETRVLMDVLTLPLGVEIYDLLTRWNPLRQEQWIAKPYNGKKVLVMGMGPAGFTLAHHLLMEGCAVVGMDGLKIEPVDLEYLTKPIRDYQKINEALDDRVMAGFGGVAEYGITVRWDKNFLKLIYISLLRRPCFQVYGSIRFGGTVTVEDAWTLGFDHLAIAVGAGLPRELAIENSLAPGMRQANDFLMALQLTGAAKFSSMANLQVRLPAVVIGGGLTGIDTATEVQAYYITQIEKLYHRYHILVEWRGEAALREKFDRDSLNVIDEFLQHARALREERRLAAREGRAPDLIRLLRSFGGVTVAYRRSLQESPAYRRNHEEVAKAFEEGIYYASGLEPEAVMLDELGYSAALKCRVVLQDEQGQWRSSEQTRVLPARSIFVATGAKPNIAYEYEHRGTFVREGHNYQRFEMETSGLVPVTELSHCKAPPFGPMTSYEENDYRVSFLGDTHPVFHGSVVKAIASAKRVYPAIMRSMMPSVDIVSLEAYRQFRQQITGLFQTVVTAILRHSDDLVELIVHAPMATHNFHPGQFYRVQNYETTAQRVGATCLQTEAIALLAAKSTEYPGALSFLILERGVSSRLVSTFRVGEAIAVMGPTGVPTKIPDDPETIMVIGGTMALAQLRALAPVLRERGHAIFFVACMENDRAPYHREEIERLSDVVLWVTEPGSRLSAIRPQDRIFSGELVQALQNYSDAAGLIPLKKVNRVIVVGSPDLLRRVREARQGALHDLFAKETKFFGSVYGAMQCMLKGVCAQCLQWQIDPTTGRRTKAVYACSWQEQPMELIDIDNIDERLSQNRAAEIMTNQWLDYLFEKYDIMRV